MLPLSAAQVDPQPLGPVTSVAISPLVQLDFITLAPVTHALAPLWWGRGYVGDIYISGGDTSMLVTVSGLNQIDAIVFYAKPNPFGVFSMTATASDGSVSTSTQQFIDGTPGNSGRAGGFLFYGTGTSKITSFMISSDADLAVGEFYYHNPSPSALALLGLAGLSRMRRRGV